MNDRSTDRRSMLIRLFRRYWSLLIGPVLVAGLVFALPGRAQPAVYAQAQPTPALTTSTLRSITVSGNGQVEAAPDLATVSLGVQTDAQSAAQAISQNNTKMQAVMDTLQKAGIARADIQTTQVQLTPRYENPPQASPGQAPSGSKLAGYTAINTVQVKVLKLDTLGGLLDQVVAAGGNQIQGITFDVSNPAQAMDQARQAAMSDATHKAQQLAGLANEKLGPVFSISENSQGPVPFAAAQVQSAPAGVPVSPGTQTITVNLQVTWEMEPQ